MSKPPVYIMVPRKLVIACITVVFVLFAGIVGSFQYTYSIGHQLCGVISISRDAFKTNPNPSPTGRVLIVEYGKLARKYHCK